MSLPVSSLFYQISANRLRRYVVATTTIWSGASYVYSKDAVKILTPPPVEKEKVEDEKKDPR